MPPRSEPAELHLDFAQAGRGLQPGRAGGQGVDDVARQSACWSAEPGCSARRTALSPGQIEGNQVGTAEGALELLIVQPEGQAGRWTGLPGRRGARPRARRATGRTVKRGDEGHGSGRSHHRPGRGRRRRERPISSCPACSRRLGLDERDRGFVTELAYGTLRMCRACDWLVGQFAHGRAGAGRPGRGPGRCLPAGLHAGAGLCGGFGDRGRSAGAGAAACSMPCCGGWRTLVEPGPVRWPDPGPGSATRTG